MSVPTKVSLSGFREDSSLRIGVTNIIQLFHELATVLNQNRSWPPHWKTSYPVPCAPPSTTGYVYSAGGAALSGRPIRMQEGERARSEVVARLPRKFFRPFHGRQELRHRLHCSFD